MPTAEPIASLTISVFTRPSGDCPQTNPQWKRCDCRESLYLNSGKGPCIDGRTAIPASATLR